VHRKWGLPIPFQILGKRWGSVAADQGLPAAGVASSSSSKGITKNEVEKNLHHSCMLMVEELQVIYASKKVLYLSSTKRFSLCENLFLSLSLSPSLSSIATT
jgi:hypothetical protein